MSVAYCTTPYTTNKVLMVTGSLAAQSCGHVQFWIVTKLRPHISPKYGAYQGDNPLHPNLYLPKTACDFVT